PRHEQTTPAGAPGSDPISGDTERRYPDLAIAWRAARSVQPGALGAPHPMHRVMSARAPDDTRLQRERLQHGPTVAVVANPEQLDPAGRRHDQHAADEAAHRRTGPRVRALLVDLPLPSAGGVVVGLDERADGEAERRDMATKRDDRAIRGNRDRAGAGATAREAAGHVEVDRVRLVAVRRDPRELRDRRLKYERRRG